jgi:hypothetical protein
MQITQNANEIFETLLFCSPTLTRPFTSAGAHSFCEISKGPCPCPCPSNTSQALSHDLQRYHSSF